MLGAIGGDIIGSPYEFHNIKTKDFSLFCKKSRFTDDTILTCATAEWLLKGGNPADIYRKWGRAYANRTYENGAVSAFGKGFLNWLETGKAYQAKTNGCVMRISPVGLMISDLKTALQKAEYLTNITHNHPESLTATRAYIETMYLLKTKTDISYIKNYISQKYKYNLHQNLDEIRPHYNKFYCSCKMSVPQAIICALDATSYEDAVRNAVSLGGDSDTLACMAGGLAEIRFGVPEQIKHQVLKRLDLSMKILMDKFYAKIRE